MDWVYPAVLIVLEDHIYNIKGRNKCLPRAVMPLGEACSILRRGFFFLFVIVMKKPILSRTESANMMSNTKIYEKEGSTGNEQSPTLVCIY